MQTRVQRGLRLLRSTFARNVATTFLTQVVSLVIGVANAAIVARWLGPQGKGSLALARLLYTSDAGDERSIVDLGGRRLIKKKRAASVQVGAVQADNEATEE